MKRCYICSSAKHVDNHHADCQHGEVSPDTVPLCRRCHRTYHDLGIEWFDDELLDRAIELENMRRRIFSEPLLEKSDIVRSNYWYKKHGIARPEPIYRAIPLTNSVKFRQLVRPGILPLCGWDWLAENQGRVYPQQGITLLYDGKAILASSACSPPRRGLIRSIMTMAARSTA